MKSQTCCGPDLKSGPWKKAERETSAHATLAAAGRLTGTLLIGDPRLLAVAGALSFCAATRWPEPPLQLSVGGLRRASAGQIFVGCAYKGAHGMARLRGAARDTKMLLKW